MRRRQVLGGIAAGTAMLSTPSVSRAQARKTLKFVPQADLALLDPVQTTALVTRNHGVMVFDTLYGLDEDYVPQPQMVAGHTIDDDGKTWTLTLRDGLRWHDGAPVLARDVVASIQRWWQIDAFGQTLRGVTDELSAATDQTVRFRLKAKFPLLPAVFAKPSAFCAMMPERLAKTPISVQITEIVGSGPFRFIAKERVPGSLAVYEKFAEYVPRSDGRPSFMAGPKVAHLDRVEWQTIPDAATAGAALQAGEVDWWEAPIPDLLPMLRQNTGISVEVREKSGNLGMLRLNHLIPPFDNPAIRRALLGAIDQPEYMTAVMGDERSYWKDDVGFFLPGTAAASRAGMAALTGPRDLTRVKADLAAAGYGGEKVVLLVPSDFPSLNAQSEVAMDMFRHLGVNVDYQTLDWGTVMQRIPSKEPLSKGGWNAYANYIPGLIAITPATHSFIRGLGTAGTYGWPKSEKLEQLRDAYLIAASDEARKDLCEKIQLQCFEDVPYLPTGMWTQPTAFRKSVSDIPAGFPIFWGVKKI